jgi:hypothetical protein
MNDIVDRLRDPQLHAEIKFMRAEAAAEIVRLRLAFTELNTEVCQRLGKALGYPWFKDDQQNFPGATTENGVCTGEHVAETIAAEAARWIAKVEFERDMWRSENLKKQAACEMMGERMGALEAQRDRLRAERAELRKLLVELGAGIPAAAILRAEDRA